MSELKPTAFRVFDNVEKRYVQDDHLTDEKAPAYVLADTGWLAIIYRKGGAKPADESRYTVERWTGLYDAKGKAVYVGDIIEVHQAFDLWEVREASGYFMAIYANAHDTYLDWLLKGKKGECLGVVGTIHDRSAEQAGQEDEGETK